MIEQLKFELYILGLTYLYQIEQYVTIVIPVMIGLYN